MMKRLFLSLLMSAIFVFPLLAQTETQSETKTVSNHAAKSVAAKFFLYSFLDHDAEKASALITDDAVLLGSGTNFKDTISEMPDDDTMNMFTTHRLYMFDKSDMESVTKEVKAEFPEAKMWDRLKEQLATENTVVCVAAISTPGDGIELFAVIVGKVDGAWKIIAADSGTQE